MYSLCTENLINLHRTETRYNKRKKHFPAAVWLRVSATAHFCGCWLTAVLQVVIFVLWLICLKLYNEISPRSHCPAFLFAYIKLSSDRKRSDPGTERERYVTENVWWTFLSAWWENVNSSKLPWKPDLWDETEEDYDSDFFLSMWAADGEYYRRSHALTSERLAAGLYSRQSDNSKQWVMLFSGPESQLCVHKLPAAPKHHKHTLLQGDVCVLLRLSSQ